MSENRLERLLMAAAQAPGKKVLVVEGPGDTAFLTLMLDKPPFREANVFARFVILEAGGKDAALKMLDMRPDYSAMVDRDAWTSQECEKKQRAYPSLHILPRFCIENFLICPEELAAAFPSFDLDAEAIRREIPSAIRHGCLWRAAQPLYDRLMQSGFNRALLRYPPPKERELEKLLRSWQALLSPEAVQAACNAAFEEAKGESEDELIRTFVHGKIFWKNVVEPRLSSRFPGRSSEELKRLALRRLRLAPDLKSFFENIFQ